MRAQTFLWAALAAAVAAGPARAGIIRVDGPFDLGSDINRNSPIGQTFTAEDAQVRAIGFHLHDLNPSGSPGDHAVTVTLFDAATGGSVVAARAITGLADGFSGFADADFTGVTLTVGHVYRAEVSDTTARWAVDSTDNDPYAGGTMIEGGSPVSGADIGFEVIPAATSAAPAPPAAALLGMGVVSLCGYGWRRKKVNV